MAFLIYTVSLKTIQAIFFQNGDFHFSQVVITPIPAIFDGLPYPLPPIFFLNQNNHKGCTLVTYRA